MVAKTWIMHMEKLFSGFKLTEEQKDSLAAFTLTRETEHLWHLKKEIMSTPTI